MAKVKNTSHASPGSCQWLIYMRFSIIIESYLYAVKYKMTSRPRGRPRKFDQQVVLSHAIELFLAKGFEGASLDDLAEAMNMSRPSLYNAFGNKEAIYRHAIEQFTSELKLIAGGALFQSGSLEQSLHRFYRRLMDVYYASDPPRGCLVFCTTPVESISHADIAEDFRRVIAEIDTVLKSRFEQAQAVGDFPAEGDCALAGQLAQALLHSLALRARSGAAKQDLDKLIQYGTNALMVV